MRDLPVIIGRVRYIITGKSLRFATLMVDRNQAMAEYHQQGLNQVKSG